MIHRWDPKDYAKNSGAQQGWAEELIERLELRGHEAVLDVGCGDGRMTAVLADRVPDGRVVGVDSSADMVAFARETFADRVPQLSFEQVDASAILYASEFDVVYSNAALHHVRDHVPVVKGIAGALISGGVAMLSFGGRGNVAKVSETFEAVIRERAWSEFFIDESVAFHFHGPDDYAQWLGDAGMEVIGLELVPKDMVHSPEKFEAWIRTTWVRYTNCVPEDRREAFVADIVGRYLEAHPLDSDGCAHVQMVRLEVVARKR